MENEQFGLAVFLKDYGGHILALIALLQVWLIAAWKRFVARPKLSLHPAATIEVGFSTFGPTVALIGTLRAENDEAFVERMKINVIRLKDKAEHSYNWVAFRPNSISTNPQEPIRLEIASGFLVSPKAPKQYHVFFASNTFKDEHHNQLQSIAESWIPFVQTTLKELKVEDTDPDTLLEQALKNPLATSALFDQFFKTQEVIDLHTDLSHDFFWRAGTYNFSVIVECSDGIKIKKEWRFELSDKDEKDLRLNIVTMVREQCGLPITYGFSYKPYS